MSLLPNITPNTRVNVMKTTSNMIRLVLATAVFGLLASFAHAAPPKYPAGKFRPITTVKEAEAVKPGDSEAMVCGKCKTVAIREYQAAWQNGKGPARWTQVGTSHSCDGCGGTIKVVKGKTADTMQHDCSVCGEGAAFCCVASADSEHAAHK